MDSEQPPIPPQKPQSTGEQTTGEQSLHLTCPHCQQVASILASQAGTIASCPNCSGQFQVPQANAAAGGQPYGSNYQPNPYAAGAAGVQGGYSGYQGQLNPMEVQQFASKKIAAGICGILLGGFGVHKFILGFNGAGAIMLTVYLICAFLGSCLVIPLIGSVAIGIIGFIEGILYLTKSDEEFFQTYAIQRKEWF